MFTADAEGRIPDEDYRVGREDAEAEVVLATIGTSPSNHGLFQVGETVLVYLTPSTLTSVGTIVFSSRSVTIGNLNWLCGPPMITQTCSRGRMSRRPPTSTVWRGILCERTSSVWAVRAESSISVTSSNNRTRPTYVCKWCEDISLRPSVNRRARPRTSPPVRISCRQRICSFARPTEDSSPVGTAERTPACSTGKPIRMRSATWPQ